ncbi:MAG: beta-lactamase family protein [Sulfurovum sp.]|nr:beta-lactamase family protein [Sulfurovum sp.]
MKRKCKIIKKIPLIASLAFLVGCTTTPEPKAFTSKADKYAYVKEYMRWYIKEQMDDKDLVGLSVALVDDQKIVWSEGFGYADKEKGIKATPQTRYRAGSITKLFTDMAVMKLSEEGKMDIDKPFKTYLPEFKIKSRFGSTDDITPRNIMSHHSGLPSEWLDRMFDSDPLPYTEHVNLINNEYVATKPNTVFSYSNLGLTLLGYSVEKVSGMQYAKYVDKVLLAPLDMIHSDLEMALSGENASKSYSKGKETNELAIGEVPAGALNTSVEELAHLAMMINADGKYGHQQLLKASTLKKMFTVQNANVPLDVGFKIGLGYFVDNELLGEKDTVYQHGGNTIAQNAYFAVSPHSKLGVVVMSNNAGTDAKNIANKLLQKTWEAKTGKKVEKKKLIVSHNSDFSGIYSTVIGKVTIEKGSKDEYIAKTNSGKFKLYKTKNNTYKLKYKLLGLIPLGDDELDKVELYTDEIEGNHVIVASMEGQTFLGGVKVEIPKHIPEVWHSYMGQYKIINNFEPKEWKIKETEFKIEDGFALIKQTYNSGEKSTTIIKPINDTEAIIEGLGRSMQETIYVKDGVVYAQGLRFEKIEKKK